MKKIALLLLCLLLNISYAYSNESFRDLPYFVQLELLGKTQKVARVYAQYLGSVIESLKNDHRVYDSSRSIGEMVDVRTLLVTKALILKKELNTHTSGKGLEKKSLAELEFMQLRMRSLDKLISSQHAFGNEEFFEKLNHEVADLTVGRYRGDLFAGIYLLAPKREKCSLEIYFHGQTDLFEIAAREFCQK